MGLKDKVLVAAKGAGTLFSKPRQSRRVLARMAEIVRGYAYTEGWPASPACPPGPSATAEPSNPLRQFFDARQTGRGIWKWSHYFDIYHRHFSKFVGAEVHVLEIGIFSGGSLDMWKAYFGPQCRLYGVDIEPSCQKYADQQTKVFIGDQADRQFWNSFRRAVPRIDIVIDDGGHLPHQQIVTLEELLPHLSRGGVYLCEDVQSLHQGFAAYIYGLADSLNRQCGNISAFQRDIHSVHLYPYVAVVEKCAIPRDGLSAPRHGTEWQPFL